MYPHGHNPHHSACPKSLSLTRHKKSDRGGCTGRQNNMDAIALGLCCGERTWWSLATWVTGPLSVLTITTPATPAAMRDLGSTTARYLR